MEGCPGHYKSLAFMVRKFVYLLADSQEGLRPQKDLRETTGMQGVWRENIQGKEAPPVKNTPAQTLASVAQLVSRRYAERKVTGSVPGQGTCLGCGSVSGQGRHRRQPVDVSLSH